MRPALLNPLFAAFIHVVSELAFILNSARLLRGAPRDDRATFPGSLLERQTGGGGLHEEETGGGDLTAAGATVSTPLKQACAAIDEAMPRRT